MSSVISPNAGCCPSEAHGGGWEGLGKDGEKPAPHGDIPEGNTLFEFTIRIRKEILEGTFLSAVFYWRGVDKKGMSLIV
jgi:hypothetical protein